MASLASSITEIFTRKKESAKERYLAAVRSRKSAEAIAAAATEANVAPEQVLANIAVLEQAAELSAVVEKIPALIRAKDDASKRFLDTDEKLKKVIAPLEQSLFELSAEIQRHDADLRTARSTLQTVYALYRDNPELLPLADGPSQLKAHINADTKREAEEDAKRDLISRVVAAQQKLSDARSFEHRVRYNKWPYDMQMAEFDPNQVEMSRDNILAGAVDASQKAERELEVAQAAAKKGCAM